MWLLIDGDKGRVLGNECACLCVCGCLNVYACICLGVFRFLGALRPGGISPAQHEDYPAAAEEQ